MLVIAVVLGTRPEIIKCSPIIRECQERGLDFYILHTGQHYDFEMDAAFFRDLELPEPKYNLGVGSGSHAEQTAKIMLGIEKVLVDDEPDVVLVQGDTNTVLGGALVSSKLCIQLGHVEAGLRSGDLRMPEEVNRIVADHVSDILFAPTEVSRGNLIREGIGEEKIRVTGNTVVDAVGQNLEISRKLNALGGLGVEPRGYVLVTLHRTENVDDEGVLRGLLKALKEVQRRFSVPVVFPVHPRTRKMISSYGLSTRGLITMKPLGYLEFLQLESQARLILTDSGGVQEEACILGVPCLTLRGNTERPETVAVGANSVVGTEPESIVRSARVALESNVHWVNPFGDGRAAARIIDALS